MITTKPNKNIILKLIFLINSITIFSCIHIERHPASGYSNNLEQHIYNLKNNIGNHDHETLLFQQSALELGININKTLTEEEKSQILARKTLISLEEKIINDADKTYYYNFKPFMQDDYERISFLLLKNKKERAGWINKKKYNQNSPPIINSYKQQIITKGDLALGMLQHEVLASWGNPKNISVSGNKLYKNEKWEYIEYIPSINGYQREERTIYFESGRLVGWETTKK